MSVARRFEFVIGPFLIIDLAKISAFPVYYFRCCWPDQSSHPFCHRMISVQSQVASNNGRPRFRSGSLFGGSGPFPSRWPLLNFAVALEIDPKSIPFVTWNGVVDIRAEGTLGRPLTVANQSPVAIRMTWTTGVGNDIGGALLAFRPLGIIRSY